VNLRDDIRSLLLEAEETTAGNTGMTLVIAFNYGSRDEIARAAARLAADVQAGKLDPSQIDAQKLNDCLDTAGIPDPDLVIRTSGEERLSNFLLWQAAYAELMFVPDFWPDFTPALFDSVLERYASRDRRFGGLSTKAVAVGS
jgi:undecaprenyl diphosphate synthase